MWAMDGGPRDPVRLFEEFLKQRPLEMRTSGPLYLAIIQRSKTKVWYTKSRMGEHKLGSIRKPWHRLPIDRKRISHHSTRKSVIAKIKKARQPRNKIIQITSHANKSSLDDHEKVEEDERGTLSHMISGYSRTHTKTKLHKHR